MVMLFMENDLKILLENDESTSKDLDSIWYRKQKLIKFVQKSLRVNLSEKIANHVSESKVTLNLFASLAVESCWSTSSSEESFQRA